MTKGPDRDLINKMNSALTEDIRTILEKVLVKQLKSINSRLEGLEKGQDRILIKVGGIEKEQNKQRATIKKIQETLNVAIRSFDREDMNLCKGIQRIESHLGLPRFE